MRTFIVYEGRLGLHFKKGKFERTLPPGQYRFFGNQKVYDVKSTPDLEQVLGQEVLTSDGGTVRVSLAVAFQLRDVRKALDKGMITINSYAANCEFANRVHFQVAIRHYIGARTLDEVMSAPDALSASIRESMSPRMEECGYELTDVLVIDLNPTGGLKAAVTDLLKVEYEGKVALARARNEAATMRSLLNTARLVREHPKLLELRILASGQKPRVTFLVGDTPAGEATQTVLEDEQN